MLKAYSMGYNIITWLQLYMVIGHIIIYHINQNNKYYYFTHL